MNEKINHGLAQMQQNVIQKLFRKSTHNPQRLPPLQKNRKDSRFINA